MKIECTKTVATEERHAFILENKIKFSLDFMFFSNGIGLEAMPCNAARLALRIYYLK